MYKPTANDHRCHNMLSTNIHVYSHNYSNKKDDQKKEII